MPPRRLILDGRHYELRAADVVAGSLEELLHNYLLGLAKTIKRQLPELRLQLDDEEYRIRLYWQRKRRPEEKAAGRDAAQGTVELRYGNDYEISVRFHTTANLAGWATGNNWHLPVNKAAATVVPDIVQHLRRWNNEEPS